MKCKEGDLAIITCPGPNMGKMVKIINKYIHKDGYDWKCKSLGTDLDTGDGFLPTGCIPDSWLWPIRYRDGISQEVKPIVKKEKS